MSDASDDIAHIVDSWFDQTFELFRKVLKERGDGHCKCFEPGFHVSYSMCNDCAAGKWECEIYSYTLEFPKEYGGGRHYLITARTFPELAEKVEAAIKWAKENN